MDGQKIPDLERALGYRFRDSTLLQEALRHPSAAPESGTNSRRFEFLGDRVLGLIVAERLLDACPDASAGELHTRYEFLVNRNACAAAARRADLGPHLEMGRGEARSGGRDRDSALAEAMEGVMAAVFLDGGLDAARKMVLRLWEIDTQAAPPVRNAKSLLQEWAQKEGLGLPEYELRETTPLHTRAQVRVGSLPPAEASAPTRREAERAAAEVLLARIQDAR